MIKSSINPLIIFGNGSMAHAAGQYIFQHNLRQIAAYTVDAKFIDSTSFQGKPLVPFDAIETLYAPESYDLIIPLGYWNMNHLRENRLNEAKLKGYQIASYISPHCVIANDVQINENSLIYELAIIRGSTTLGANLIINAGANIGHHCVIGAHSFIASGVITGGNVTIGDYCVIGLGAILRDGISIASGSFIGAGSVVTSDITDSGLYYGNPAKRQQQSALEACVY